MSEFWTRVEDGLPETDSENEVDVLFIDKYGNACTGVFDVRLRLFLGYYYVREDGVQAWAYVPPLEKK